MNNNIIQKTLDVVRPNNFYYLEANRKWQSLKVIVNPLGETELTCIKYLQDLAILDCNEKVNPIIEHEALFISFKVGNDDLGIGETIMRTEILISIKGIEFLKTMNQKLYMEKGGYTLE